VSARGVVDEQSAGEAPTAQGGGRRTAGAIIDDLERRFASSQLDDVRANGGARANAGWLSDNERATDGADVPLDSTEFLDPNPSFAYAAAPEAAARDTATASESEESPAPDDYMGRLRLARRRRVAGRVEDALLEYRALLRDSTDSLDDLIHDLRDMIGESDSSEVQRLLGDAYIREGSYVNALEAYNRALALSQDASH
jgi:tetratricopeptide (TPR) repeat protein